MRQKRPSEKAKAMEATSDEDTCSGFEDHVMNSQMKAMVSAKGQHMKLL